MATAKVGVSSLLASAFSTSLDSRVITYDQYKKEKEKIKDGWYKELDIDRLFDLSHITGSLGDQVEFKTRKVDFGTQKSVPHTNVDLHDLDLIFVQNSLFEENTLAFEDASEDTVLILSKRYMTKKAFLLMNNG